MDTYEKQKLNNALNEYVNLLSDKKREKLTSEFLNNPTFKQEFGERLYELAQLCGSLANNHEELFEQLSSKFLQNTKTNNKYIIQMYKFYLKSLKDIFEEDYGEEKAQYVFEKINNMVKKYLLYDNLKQDLSQHKQNVRQRKI